MHPAEDVEPSVALVRLRLQSPGPLGQRDEGVTIAPATRTNWSYGVRMGPGAGRGDAHEVTHRPRDRASSMIESSLDCVVTLDAAGTIVEFNPAAERVFGWTRDEALGCDLASLIIPVELREAHRQGLAHHLGDGTTSHVLGNRLEMPALRRDGSRITVELMVVAIDHDGEQEYTGFIRDVTELRETQAQMRTLIDNLASAVLLEDVSGHVLVANNALVDLFDLPVGASEITGMDSAGGAEQVQHIFADPAGFVAAVQQAREGMEPILNASILMADGRTLERDFLPIHVEGRAAGNLWVYRDVTLTIAQQELLKEQNRSLEQLSEMRNEFVARASHELRSPLTSVVSFADMLAEPEIGPLNDQQSQFIKVILRNADRLLRLIEDLLLVTKLESRTLPLSLDLVDPLMLATQVTTELAPVASGAQVALSCAGAEGPWIRGDAVRLQQVLTNLVNNAIAYTPAGGEVDVRVEPDHESSRWRITVSDTGLGIDHDELPLLFDAFFRASSAASARASKGTGLGLAIVRLIVEEHGGTIEVASILEVGTSVTVWLPFHEEGED